MKWGGTMERKLGASVGRKKTIGEGGVTVVREKHEIVSLGIVSSSIRRIEYGRSSCAGGGGMVIARPTLP